MVIVYTFGHILPSNYETCLKLLFLSRSAAFRKLYLYSVLYYRVDWEVITELSGNWVSFS